MSNISRWIFERNGNAVASLLFAVAGLIGFGVILGPIAIGLGLMARRQIADSGRPGHPPGVRRDRHRHRRVRRTRSCSYC